MVVVLTTILNLMGMRLLGSHNYITMNINSLAHTGCSTLMLPGPPLCSFKRVCQDDLVGTLHSSDMALWCGEYNINTSKVFLLSKDSQDVHRYIRSYIVCAIIRPSIKKYKWYTLVTPNNSWESVSMYYIQVFHPPSMVRLCVCGC